MHKIEQAIQVFLEDITNKTPDQFEDLINEFGENCKKALSENLLNDRTDEPFKVRMSNIGKPLRQLMLEEKYGREPLSADVRLKMTYGYIWESFLIFLLKASGLNVEDGKEVSLDISYGDNQKYTVNGTYDLKIDGELYDVKSASPWSYDNKFKNFDTVKDGDPFGYVGQAMGYSIADKSYFNGWIVCDKSDGRIKVVEVPRSSYREIAKEYLDSFKEKLDFIFNKKPIPECTGVIEEKFYKKPTGKKVLSKECEFCNFKYKCHKNLEFKEVEQSKALNKPRKYYVN